GALAGVRLRAAGAQQRSELAVRAPAPGVVLRDRDAAVRAEEELGVFAREAAGRAGARLQRMLRYGDGGPAAVLGAEVLPARPGRGARIDLGLRDGDPASAAEVKVHRSTSMDESSTVGHSGRAATPMPGERRQIRK